jgi:hypothetical protein
MYQIIADQSIFETKFEPVSLKKIKTDDKTHSYWYVFLDITNPRESELKDLSSKPIQCPQRNRCHPAYM